MNQTDTYRTRGGIQVTRVVEEIGVAGATDELVDALDTRRGVLLASSYEYPGRYTRWDMGFIDPPLQITAQQRAFSVRALNSRGAVLLGPIEAALRASSNVESVKREESGISGRVIPSSGSFPEEERSKQPTMFSVIRVITELFSAPDDRYLGFYGAFGYDLAFQFEPIRLKLERPADQRDLVLFLPDKVVVVDHQRGRAAHHHYDFSADGLSTAGLPRTGDSRPYRGMKRVARACDHGPGEYAETVRLARNAFKRGDLFEVVPGQTFFEACAERPSAVFRRLKDRNPAPYGFLMNLGESEYLIGASPEMYVRVDGDRVETCPISGTIARGHDPISDAAQILELLNSGKDEAELTMCTDVDRNDKSRICVPGTVRVIGRRQIEMYSRVIHTVDHVEGRLRAGFDALDAFLAHTWAVTVTGAPKAWAMQFIEEHEHSPRAWYGGAVGLIGFDGNMNTGLTLRTIRVKDGVAQVRAGATLLFDSDPDAEEAETRIKAAALLDAIRRPETGQADRSVEPDTGHGKRVILVDHQDSFVHTLGNYLRQTGAEVVTLRYGFPADELDRRSPDLMVLSPGPGTPEDFDMSGTIASAIEREIPVFGVCLGLQGIVEHFGGSLGVLDYPMHGKPSCVRPLGGKMFEGLPDQIRVGRYHSLFAVPDLMPAELTITARSEDGVIMAVEHRTLPVAAVQFHPESIMSLEDNLGMQLIRNVVARLAK